MHITAFIVASITKFIATTGYSSIVILMALESMIAPVPSEAVMPFAGFLISTREFTFLGVIAWSTVGSIIGSLLSYVIGAYGGRPFIEKFGRYLLLNTHHLDTTERFFNKYGPRAIFISRFIPVIRHLISIPAGVGKMPLGKFCLYTTLGAGLWNALLAYVGYALKNNWEKLGAWFQVADILVIAAIVAGVIYIIYKWKKTRGKNFNAV